ncbi:restriction endonuclease subunit S [Streptomyces sp. NPDC057684]|uniref:restriction endonuclease subunit S n=1 Tax=Streptomyces sp. NPDC057684 TaxID=3346211 RepID=UPI0036BA2F78
MSTGPWPIVSLRRIAEVIDCAHLTAPFVEENQYPVASIRECASPAIDLTDCNYTTAEYFTLLRGSGRTPRAGDLVFIRNVSVGLVSIVMPDTPEFALGQETVLIRRGPGTDSRFLRYSLTSHIATHAIESAMVGATFRRINVAAIRSLAVPMPPLDEQHAIANFLDRETDQIDALISKQEEFIEFLRERRSGLIASAVAGHERGADPESDQASWIGPCPPGWTRGQVKNFGSVTLGKMLQSDNKDSDVFAPYMRAANVQPDGELALADVKSMWFNPRELRMLDLRAGDVVVVEGGIGGYGRAAFISEPLEGWGFQNSINRIRPVGENDGRYLTYFLIMARQKGFIAAYCNIVSMPHLTAEKLAAIPMMIPPSDLQRQIADRLDKQTAKINALIVKAQEHISYAKERRAALITAAVTGQINLCTVRKAG